MARLRWSARALASLTAQDDFLRARNPQAANAVLAEIEALAELLAEFPEMGRRIEGTGLRFPVCRRYRYRLIYRIAGNDLHLLDVLNPASVSHRSPPHPTSTSSPTAPGPSRRFPTRSRATAG